MESHEKQSYELGRTASLLTLAEVARHLSVSRSTAYRLVAAGELSPVHVGRRCVRYRPSEIERLVERGSRAPASKDTGEVR